MHDENCILTNRGYLGRVKISVVVPAFNEEKLLGASLAEIKTADRKSVV